MCLFLTCKSSLWPLKHLGNMWDKSPQNIVLIGVIVEVNVGWDSKRKDLRCVCMLDNATGENSWISALFHHLVGLIPCFSWRKKPFSCIHYRGSCTSQPHKVFFLSHLQFRCLIQRHTTLFCIGVATFLTMLAALLTCVFGLVAFKQGDQS